MKKTLKTVIKGLALVAMGVVCTWSARAQYAPLGGAYTTGDAVAGFTTGSGNELIVNLGAISSITNGEQWNLSTLLGSGSGNAGFTSLNKLNWGVIGVVGSGRTYTSYSTVLGMTNVNASDAGDLITLFGSGGINSSGVEVDSASSADSWYNNVQTFNSGNDDAPYSYLGGTPDMLTPASGSFTLAQDTATWFNNATATTNHFAFSSSGILMFTNTASASGAPTPRIVAITRSASTSTIYFTTANGFTYTLYYTNSAGLTAPMSQWPASPTTLTGNGLTNNLTDTTALGARFYRISAH